MTTTEHQIVFEQLGLGGVLKQNQLMVPPNQREYKWEEQQVTQLVQDFAIAIGAGDYFLGTIVTIPRHGGYLEVVDGQQRLATVAILLAAIRDYLEGKEDILVEALNSEFLTGIDRNKLARIPKLKLNIDDNELFSRIITKEGDLSEVLTPSRESHQLLMGARKIAANHVLNIVSGLDVKDHPDRLNQWISFIEKNALVVLLRVPDDADAYKMFETLNDRGLRTSQADLVKNYLFGRSGDRFTEVQSRWSYMRGALETLEEEDITINFLRHALIVIHGFVREANVYDRVQEIVKSELTAISFATTIENLAYAYIATFNPDHERWNDYPEQARRALHVFDLFNIRPTRPLILAIAAKMEAKEATKAFQFLLSLSVRLLIASSTRSASVEVPLAVSAHQVFQGEIQNVSGLKDALSQITPTDGEFKEAFERISVSSSKLARYYLRSLEMNAKGEAEPWFIPSSDPSVINLEHVLPKKPAEGWSQFTTVDAGFYSNRLGNQVLMRASDNSGLGNNNFAKKKQVYCNSPYVLTSQIAELDDWTPDSITRRQQKLAELALKTWPV